MRNLIGGMFLSVLVLFTVSCGDNLFEGISDKNSSEAKRDELDFAFIEGNCSFIVSELGKKEPNLNAIERYQYSNAVLACSGFDLVNSLGSLLDKNGSKDPFDLIQNLMGTSILSQTKIDELQASYGKVLSSCANFDILDSNMKTVCGMAAAADTVLTVSDLALKISGSESIDATKEGLTSALNGKSESEIQDAVNKEIGNGNMDLDSLSNNLDTISGAAGIIAEQAGGEVEFSKELDKFTDDLTDENGNITSGSLANYISSQFK